MNNKIITTIIFILFFSNILVVDFVIGRQTSKRCGNFHCFTECCKDSNGNKLCCYSMLDTLAGKEDLKQN
ncbi:hypothetical protein ACQ4LE_000527 [Meloidogyne hapla]